MHRKLDEPVRAPGTTEEALDEYIALLDHDTPGFFSSGQLPSAARWRELIPTIIGPGVWKIYGELAPDLVEAVGPVIFVR